MKLPIVGTIAERTRNFLLVFLSLLFVGVIFWIIITLVTSQKNTKVPETSKRLAEPLKPVLDTSKLDTLNAKRYYTPEELKAFPINIIETDVKNRSKRVIQIQPT